MDEFKNFSHVDDKQTVFARRLIFWTASQSCYKSGHPFQWEMGCFWPLYAL